MTKKIYYFNELGEDNLLYPLAQVSKDILQHNELVVRMYQKYNEVLYGHFRGESSIQLGLDKPILFSPGPVISRSTPQYIRVASNAESNSKDNKVWTTQFPNRGRQSAINEDDILPGKENKAFSLCETPNKYTANDQCSGYLEEQSKLLAGSTQLDQKNVISNPGIKSSDARNELMLFRSMPRYIQSSGVVEMETDISFKPKESLFLPTVYKSAVTAANGTEVKRSFKKGDNFFKDSKTWTSLDFRHLPKNKLISSIVAKTSNPRKLQLFDLEKEHLSYKLLEEESPTNDTLETVPSLVNNVEPKTLRYYMNQVYTFGKLTDEYIDKFQVSLYTFQDDLRNFKTFLENVQFIIQSILVYKDQIDQTEQLRKDISGFKRESSKLKEKIGSLEMEVDEDIQSWVKNFEEIQKWAEIFEEIRNLKPTNEETEDCDQPLTTVESVYSCENNLKTIRKKVGDMICVANSRIRSFLSTAGDFVVIVKCFIHCLISVGILKPPPKSKM